MLAQALECVLLQTFYSLKNTLVPTLIGFATTILHVLLAWWMVSVLPTDDPRGIALAYTIARTVKVVAVYIPLVLALKGPQLRTQVGFFAQVAIATAAMGAVMWLAYGAVVAAHPMASRKDGLLVFGACVLVGAVAYVTAGALLRIPELDAARRAVRERLARRRAKPEA
jgi:peptidoglycan biosynthesis protein MviN/MurJ (putative lipid II flippase)